MRRFQFTLFILFATLFGSGGCQKEEPVPVEKKPLVFDLPMVVDATILSSEDPTKITPYVRFRYPVNENLKALGDKNIYKIVIESIVLQYDQVTRDLSAQGEYSEDNKELFLQVEDFPAPDSKVTFSIRTRWEIYENEVWQAVTYQNEVISREFSVSEDFKAPLLIPQENVLASYPVDSQYNFHWQEYPKGYMILKRNQNWWDGNSGNSLSVNIYNNQGYQVSLPLQYFEEEKKFEFKMPTDFSPETVYFLTFSYEEGGNTHEIFKSRFRTSRYSRFEEKAEAMVALNTGWMRPLYDGIDELGHTYKVPEAFDSKDIQVSTWIYRREAYIDMAFEYQKGLVQLQAVFEGNSYYEDYLYPKIYEPFDWDLFTVVTNAASLATTSRRDTSIIGYPPVEDMNIRQDYTPKLTAEVIEAGHAPSEDGEMAVIFAMGPTIAADWQVLGSLLATEEFNGGTAVFETERYKKYKELPYWKPFTAGEYKYKMSYTLPGIEVVTFSREYSLFVF